MERITEKNHTELFDNKYHVATGLFSENGMKAIDKLGQLEDIEDYLGIDLITLFKALEEGIYTIRSKGKKRYPVLTHNNAVGYVFQFIFEPEGQYILIDYGETWALTKEELE